MKEPFRKVLSEINFNLDSMLLFDSLLSSVLVFLGSFLVLSVFNVAAVFALVPAVMFFAVEYYIRFSEDKARIVEKLYPELDEMLRTAEDNVSLQNPIVEELHEDVVGKLKHVRLSSFLNSKRIIYKILASIVMCFVIISFSVFGININILAPIIDDIPFFNRNRSLGQLDGLTTSVNISDDIYGENSVAKLGDSLIDIRIKPSTFEVSVKDYGDSEVNEFYEAFPSEIYVEKTTAYEEKVPKEQQELVKNYFKKMSEG